MNTKNYKLSFLRHSYKYNSRSMSNVETIPTNSYRVLASTNMAVIVSKWMPRILGIPGNYEIHPENTPLGPMEAVCQILNGSDQRLQSSSVHKVLSKKFLEFQEYQ